MMSLQLKLRQTKERTRRKKMAHRKHCPICGSTSLLNEGPDQFCCACDWDTCAEYVERGLMNNIEVAFKEHFLKQEELVVSLKPRKKSIEDERQAEPRPVEVGV